MRLLSYSPSYSSSSSTTTFDATMCNSKSATAGCLAGILRRILCSGNFPTHPADQIVEADSVVYGKDQEFKAKDKIETASTPGIVVRLMGLESMPEINWMNSRSITDSISRSRSMNSADHLAGFDPMQGQHRRVKSTLSFREMPTFLELENENFLILNFENGGKSTRLRSRGRESDLGFGELKQRRAERCNKVENKTERLSEKMKKKKMDNNKGDREDEKVSDNLNGRDKRSKRISEKANEKAGNNGKAEGSTITASPLKSSTEKRQIAIQAVKTSISSNHGDVINGGKLRKKKTKKKNISPCLVQKAESECSSEDSSPVSVLGFGHFLTDCAIPTSEQDSSLSESKSRRKLSSELENYREKKSPRNDNNLIGDGLKTQKIDGQYYGTKQKESRSRNYEEVWGEILRLTEAELVGSNWVCRETWKHEDYFEGIGVNFELGILDQLLDELVGQLAGLP